MSGKKLGKKPLTLIIGIVVLLLLAGLMVYLLKTPADKNASSSAASSEGPTILGKTVKDIKSVDVVNETGSFTISKSGENYTVTNFLAPGATEVNTLSAAKFSSSVIASAVESLTTMTSGGTVEDGTKNLALYGLDKPAATLKINFNDGKSFALDVGKEAPDNINYYVLDKQANKVLLIANTSMAISKNAKETYADTTLFPTAESVMPASSDASSSNSQAKPTVKQFTFGGTLRPEPVVLEQKPATEAKNEKSALTDSGFRVVSPKNRIAGLNPVSKTEQAMWGVTASSTYAVAPTPEQLAETGLAEPYSTMKVVYEGGQAELKLGKQTAEGYYCQTSLSDAIFVVAKSSVPWAEYTAFDFYDKFTIIPNIKDVSALTIDVNGKSYRFEIGHDKSDDTKIIVKQAGKDVNDEAFRSLYRLCIGAAGESILTEQPTTPAVMKFTYEYVDTSRKADVLEFKAINERQLGLIVNGQGDFAIRSIYMDKVIASIDPVLKGEKIETEW
ncbi:DUF4340 domain-containing protein [Acetanaerobacterium elongatum]|uniref:DUF4340 domain-containing protein n=1 Tax=Acetanaerobacterium elongatum TaxID=258515 RepID=A0A1H0DGC1_9FIRM|nr:DUF4340 domain-containing protein [Acetanaerobacterium elongatum]SDN69210.1 protein of unknown function [Acetanaerobacterium elongatum]